MASRIILNAFDMTCVSHQAAGTWRHPDSQAWKYKDLDYWVDLAKLLERGHFDSLFIADVVGVYDIYRGSVETSLIDADQVPVNDPFFQVPAMALATKHLGFGVTSALTYELPYALARKFSTLDHLTKGRVAWNVVTSYLNSAAVNLGLKQQISHDERYDIADEFLDVTYKLWEGSWDEDAVLRDREKGVFTDPSKVHPIGHKGKYFEVPGIHLSEPSPQRTPVIFQAGASSRGRAFAAKHAEGVFISPATPEQAREVSDDIRDRAEQAGRRRDSLKIFTLLTVITGESDAAAQAKYEEYLGYANGEGMLSFYGGWTGVDFSEYDPDQPLEAIDNDSIRSVLELLATADPNRKWTPRDIIKHRSIGGLGPVLIGGPQKIADELERWVDVGGIDGFNLGYAITPGTFEDFIEFVVPELQRRGRVRTAYEGETLRQNLLDGDSSYVADDHPAARYRGAFKDGANATDHTKPSKFADLL
ncbi:LLM class flavin-dependent oxidoreductase [Stutzerimonas kirkiae]|uniref:5,10-methylene tetrahydromethanopterin reductase n=1 Tax=Stutzerimonas kirkiae TaxID=2211392 RepID=A0A4Q9RDP5_9GAMM|nr:LLM class flavin-dependent oxidoreductase [Stutzerimonas kirkiae]TBU98622.1 5,10-methylene tetrahydromethanopterin reductase [Stutzerimonas kirkiae]TBV04205.1 5,10-methylene tetrahydromethanopterin reductase [Stutzerimonas kirkiae]TBV10909.1 5,10-methylene tetrahydromethanopterin reductase [Stutzerimonas kirkiae]TBV14269.1 5,10-methylene tetrahydromethanopterin reductase [Stutzerimonas kirkiae]